MDEKTNPRQTASGSDAPANYMKTDAVLAFKEFYDSIGSEGNIPEQEAAKTLYNEGFDKYIDAVTDAAVARVMRGQSRSGTLHDKIETLYSAMKDVARETVKQPSALRALETSYDLFKNETGNTIKAQISEGGISADFLQAATLKSLMFGYQTILMTKGIAPERNPELQRSGYEPATN